MATSGELAKTKLEALSKTLKSLRLETDDAISGEIIEERVTEIALLFCHYVAIGELVGDKFLTEVEQRWPDATDAEVVLAVSIADEVQNAFLTAMLSNAEPAGHA